jgi:hypothetical protein
MQSNGELRMQRTEYVNDPFRAKALGVTRCGWTPNPLLFPDGGQVQT